MLSLMALLLMQACHPEPFLNVSPTSLSFNQDGGSQTVRVSANYAWTVSISGTGLTVSPLSGEGEGTVTVTAAPAGTAVNALVRGTATGFLTDDILMLGSCREES